MKAALGLALMICLSFALSTEAILQTSEEEFTTCVSMYLTEAKVNKVLGHLNTYQTTNNWLKKVQAVGKLLGILANNDILNDEDDHPPMAPDEMLKEATLEDCAEAKDAWKEVKDLNELTEAQIEQLEELRNEMLAMCKNLGKVRGNGAKNIRPGKKLKHLKQKIMGPQTEDEDRIRVRRAQMEPGTCADLYNSEYCRLQRDKGECQTEQVKMAMGCWATCGCLECMKTDKCPPQSDYVIMLPEPEDNNQEKKYTYVKYQGAGMRDDITEGVTMCACVQPFEISNTLHVIADYAVSPVSYTDTYSNSDIQRDLRKLRLEYNRNGVYLTADNQRKNLGNIPGQQNLVMETEEKSRLCVTYDLTTKKAIAYLNGRQGRAIDMNSETEIIQGKGILVLGQDQTRMEGGFDVNRSMEGTISHFKLYKRFMDEDTLTAATSEDGTFPADAEVDINTSNMRVFGRATLELQ